MLSASHPDGIDFKPFFDMVVGILFVLLILVGALLFFQTAQQDESSTREAQAALEMRQRELAWKTQAADFLASLSDHLRARGIEAKTDLDNMSVVVPIGALARVGGDGLPEVLAEPANALGGVLAQDLGCVALPSPRSNACSAFGLLRLSDAEAQVRTGPVDPAAALSQDRFGHLLASQLAAVLLHGAPDLLRMSGTDGGIVFRTTSAVSTAKPTSPGSVGGDLGIRLQFARP